MAVSSSALGTATLKSLLGALPALTRGKPYHFGTDPKGKTFVYTCGPSVFIRNLESPKDCEIYTEHVALPTVAKYAPSGFYMASGDAAGNIRIWDTTQKEHILKIELKILSGAIADIAWSDDSKRIVAVGEGKERFGAVFMFDSGSSVGEISGHAKFILTCDFKQTRPYRVATGSEDSQVGWFEGPPFKFKSSLKDHSKFVNCVRFSPDGNKLATVGSDKLGFIYDAKSGEPLTKLDAADGHSMGVYSLAWSPDSKFIVTASADKSLKIWDADKGSCVRTLTVENGTNDQQFLGVLWQGKTIVSAALNGELYYWDPESTSPKCILRGHNKSLTALAYDTKSNTLYSSAYDGHIVCWDLATGESSIFKGKGHTNHVSKMVVVADELYSCSKDDTIRATSLKTKEYGTSVGTEHCPVDLALAPTPGKSSGLVAVATVETVLLVKGEKIVFKHPVKYAPTCVAINSDETLVAVGAKDQNIYLYSVQGSKLVDNAVLKKHRGIVNAVAFHADGKHLASGDANREILVWDVTKQSVVVDGWVFHSGSISSLAWSPDGDKLVSGGIDGLIYVWSLAAPTKKIAIKEAHKGGVTSVLFVDKSTIASCGTDCAIKLWTITIQ